MVRQHQPNKTNISTCLPNLKSNVPVDFHKKKKKKESYQFYLTLGTTKVCVNKIKKKKMNGKKNNIRNSLNTKQTECISEFTDLFLGRDDAAEVRILPTFRIPKLAHRHDEDTTIHGFEMATSTNASVPKIIRPDRLRQISFTLLKH